MNKKIIGVCGARVYDQIPLAFINRLREAGLKHEYHIIAFSTYGELPENEKETNGELRLYDLMQYANLSAMVILVETLKDKWVVGWLAKFGHEKGIPVFVVDGCEDNCYNLIMDYRSGFRQMVRHVIEDHGCRRVNMLAGMRGNAFSDERIAVYKEELKDHNIPFEEERLGYGDFWDRPAREALENFLSSGLPLPEAIVCANDTMAITTCSVLNEHGLSVPEDVIVTGFDGTFSAKRHFPQITTCDPDYRGASEFIIEECMRAERQGSFVPCDYRIQFAFSPGQTCGCSVLQKFEVNDVVSTLVNALGNYTWHSIEMSNMMTELLGQTDILELAEEIPKYTHMWCDHFRFACVKRELMEPVPVPEEFSEMLTIFRVDHKVFDEPGEIFDVEDFMPRFRKVLDYEGESDTLVVRPLNFGPVIYGYTVEGFGALDEHWLQRCNEFALYLSFSIANLLHTRELNRLNMGLKEANDRLSELYLLDSMTGIYNRKGFFEEIEKRSKLEQDRSFCCVFSVDLDHLKQINDNYGHAEGDFAITTVAHSMVEAAGPDAICARFGGDEFICALFVGDEDAWSTDEFSGLLQWKIEHTPGTLDKPYALTASVGMDCQFVTGDFEVESLISRADERMYVNKVWHRKQRRN